LDRNWKVCAQKHDPALFAAFLVGIRYSGRTTAEATHAKLTVAPATPPTTLAQQRCTSSAR
jgi:hypothetical protein